MKKIILVSIISLFGISGRCQIVLGKLGTEALVEDAVKDGFLLVGTQYQLKEKSTGNLYGRGKRDYFGELYSLGYFFPQGCVLPKESLYPWEKDPDFAKYKNNDKYEPILMDSIYIKNSGKNALRKSELVRSAFQLPNTEFSCIPLGLSEKTGLPVDYEFGQVSGWFVWCMLSNGNALGKESLFSFTSFYRTIEIKDTTSVQIEAPKIGDNLLGGIFVVPKIDSIGKITLCTKGILQKGNNGKWILRVYNKDWNMLEVSEKDEIVGPTESNQDEGELKLVTSGKKKKKTKTKK